jgi:hypothetical protein
MTQPDDAGPGDDGEPVPSAPGEDEVVIDGGGLPPLDVGPTPVRKIFIDNA